MKSKMKLTPENLDEWMTDNWVLYASQMFDGKLLRLKINGCGVYQITHGETQLYQGSDRTFAVDVWNNL